MCACESEKKNQNIIFALYASLGPWVSYCSGFFCFAFFLCSNFDCDQTTVCTKTGVVSLIWGRGCSWKRQLFRGGGGEVGISGLGEDLLNFLLYSGPYSTLILVKS